VSIPTALGPPSMAAPPYRPYLSSSAEFQLGLRPFKQPQWLLRDASSVRIMREKRLRMAAVPSPHYKALPSSIPAQHELRQRVVSHLASHIPTQFQLSNGVLASTLDGTTHNVDDAGDPLLQLSGMIEEDFMLIEEVEGKQIITAACNAYSSSGRLVASVGRALPWAHEPVPELTEKLGSRIDRMLATIHPDTPCERFNWLLTPVSAIFFPQDPHAQTASTLQNVMAQLHASPERAGELLWIRVERQTLSRLPATNAVAFSIHTYSDPLSSIVADAASVRGILALLQSYSAQRLRYSEMEQTRDFAIQWLECAIERHHS
jgi:dimethylamine monooxygenase subunit A